MNKIGRNDICICGSGKKYKKCCIDKLEKNSIDKSEKNNIDKSEENNIILNCINKLEKKSNDKFKISQDDNSDIILDCINKLNNKYPKYKIINITNNLEVDNYRDYQLANFNTNIVMIAEKTIKNGLVFLTRVNNLNSNIIIMYRGAFRTFEYKDLDLIINSLSSMMI